MTRLYYHDPYLVAFEADVIERTAIDGRLVVVLSQSAFYPASGGQPHDVGTLNGAQVIDVVVREADDTVLHIIDAELDDTHVEGKVSWSRRFDHMQHHTGQHVLTRAFIETIGAETVGFHLSGNSVTIDLDHNNITVAHIDTAENLANQIVTENRSVRAWFPDSDELAGLPVRKISEKITGAVRVVDIDGFDMTACGGTHVARTGEIGMIKVLRHDKLKGELTRIEFCCGARALEDYRTKNQLLHRMATQLTTGYMQIPDVLDKLREENRSLKKSLKASQEALLGYQAEKLWQAASHQADNQYVIVQETFGNDYTPGDLQQLARHLIAHPGTVAVLGTYGETAHLVVGCSDDLDINVVPAFKAGLAVLGTERGGGRPTLAQGGGVPASAEKVAEALSTVIQQLS